MFKQSHNTVDARVENPVPFENYSSRDVSAKKLAAMFRKHAYRIARGGRPLFQSVETVAHPENRLLLKREIEASEQLGTTGAYRLGPVRKLRENKGWNGLYTHTLFKFSESMCSRLEQGLP